MSRISVCIIGLGYIGLPTAALLASRQFSVHGVDVNSFTVDTINRGEVHIVEPHLEDAVRSAVKSGLLFASHMPKLCDVFVICVPTPFHDSPGIPSPNIDYIVTAARSIAPYVRPGNLVILESTSPVGTTENVERILLENTSLKSSDIDIAYCPERVLPGNILHELVANDRIVGGLNKRATSSAALFYRSFVEGTVFETDARTAEMCKLAENSFRDVNIAFANELSLVCANEGINVWELIKLANRHPRVNILNPGVGVGGHCIAVDPWFIVSRNPKFSRLIHTGREVNLAKTEWIKGDILSAVQRFTREFGRDPVVLCLGLAFKPDIDDLRESPALELVRYLYNNLSDVLVVEPHISSHSDFELVSMEVGLERADLIIILVPHTFFRQEKYQKYFDSKITLDYCGTRYLGRNLNA